MGFFQRLSFLWLNALLLITCSIPSWLFLPSLQPFSGQLIADWVKQFFHIPSATILSGARFFLIKMYNCRWCVGGKNKNQDLIANYSHIDQPNEFHLGNEPNEGHKYVTTERKFHNPETYGILIIFFWQLDKTAALFYSLILSMWC